ncbi:MAG: hypothetical protein KAS69_04515 [Planctomycetes bacterium]|nr:hypothetical protein [Planctomycetota bacterium]
MTDEEIKLALEVINTALVLASTLAIVTTSIIAICGINVWRKEFQGKRKIELAEEVLVLFYEARDAISEILSFSKYQDEGSIRKPQEDETSSQKQVRDRAYIVNERLNKRKEVFNKLRSKHYQFIARFGNKNAKPFEDIKHIVTDIQISARIRSSRSTKEATQGEKRWRHVIWGRGENNPTLSQLESVISDIEAIYQRIIKEKNRKIYVK